MRLHAALAGLVLAACDPSPPPQAAPARMAVPLGAAPVRGPADAWVTVVVWSDLECPFCADEHPLLEQLVALYPGDVRLAWKHFPLTSRHPHARSAAIAVECAKPQGRFWEMAAVVFENQAELLPANLASYAGLAGLDPATWSACVADAATAAAVDADVAQGRALGVPGTPTIVVNGKPFAGAYPLSTLQPEVEAARAVAVASGIPRAEYYARAVLGQ